MQTESSRWDCAKGAAGHLWWSSLLRWSACNSEFVGSFSLGVARAAQQRCLESGNLDQYQVHLMVCREVTRWRWLKGEAVSLSWAGLWWLHYHGRSLELPSIDTFEDKDVTKTELSFQSNCLLTFSSRGIWVDPKGYLGLKVQNAKKSQRVIHQKGWMPECCVTFVRWFPASVEAQERPTV